MYVPPSIQSTGLKAHLDGSRDKHNGYGYDDFVKMVSINVHKSNIARIFKVNKATLDKWLKIYEQEQASHD